MPQGLKIFISDPHSQGGGQITYVCSLSRGLIQHGHEVYVLCRPKSVFVEKSSEFGYPVIDQFHFRGGLRIAKWIHDIRKIKQLLTIHQPDIIHVNGSADHWSCAIANELLNHRFCLVRTRHNTYPLRNHPLNRWLYLNCTDFYVSVCDMVRDTLIHNNHFPPERILTIHNGVDTDQFIENSTLRTQARLEFGFRETDVVCGISARLSPAKGHIYLLQALSLLKERCPELKILILGRGALEFELKTQAKSLGIEDRVTFAGYRSDIAYCTQAFDIAVLPSIDCDTSSFSLKEAMAEGKPVIASDYGGLPEIVNDGVEGKIVPAGNAEMLAKAIEELAKNPQLRKEMGERARQRVLKEFSIDHFVSKTIEAYYKALEFHHARFAHR